MSGPLDGTSIVVIGAGVAGLAAAAYGRRLGAEVIVLEARERLGGRVHTDRSLGAPVDLGAAAIHGAIGNPLTALAHAAAAETRPLDYDSITYYRANGVRIADDEAETAAQRFDDLRRDVRAQALEGESLAQTLRRIAPRAMQDVMLTLHAGVEFEFDIGGSLEEIGATKLHDHKPFGGGDLILPHGMDQLVTHLARGLDVRIGAPVQSVIVSGRSVRVSGAFGVTDADYCLCTMPIGVLKSGSVTFDPALPCCIANSIDRLGAGHVAKIALKFDRVFWDTEPLYIGHASGCQGRFPYMLNPHAIHRDANILVTFGLGDYERRLRDRTDEEITGDALSMLRNIYGAATREPSGVVVTRWQSDPYSLCSYSFASPETQRADFHGFHEVAHGHLLFAGEHTTADHRGTVHGAYLSGERAAKQVESLVQATN